MTYKFKQQYMKILIDARDRARMVIKKPATSDQITTAAELMEENGVTPNVFELDKSTVVFDSKYASFIIAGLIIRKSKSPSQLPKYNAEFRDGIDRHLNRLRKNLKNSGNRSSVSKTLRVAAARCKGIEPADPEQIKIITNAIYEYQLDVSDIVDESDLNKPSLSFYDAGNYLIEIYKLRSKHPVPPRPLEKKNKKGGNSSMLNAQELKDNEYYVNNDIFREEIKNWDHRFEDIFKTRNIKNVLTLHNPSPYPNCFYEYVKENFERFGLESLVGFSHVSPHSDVKDQQAYIIRYDGKKEVKILIDGADLILHGETIHPALIKELDDCDFVFMNPPGSLFLKFMKHVIEYEKDFLVVGGYKNMVSNKELFHLLRDDKIRFAYTEKVGKYFHPLYRLKGVYTKWLTNLSVEDNEPSFIKLTKYLNDGNGKCNYPKFDKFPDIIQVKGINNIPQDYDGLMAVNDTFMERWNRKQFEVIDIDRSYSKKMIGESKRFFLNDEEQHIQIIIRRR